MIARPEDLKKNITFSYDDFIVDHMENKEKYHDIEMKVANHVTTSIVVSKSPYFPHLIFQPNLSVCRIGYLHNIQNLFMRVYSSEREELSDKIYNCTKQLFGMRMNMNIIEIVLNSGFYKEDYVQNFLKRFAIFDTRAMPFSFHGEYNVAIQLMSYFPNEKHNTVIPENYRKKSIENQENLEYFNKIYEQQQKIRNTKEHSIATEGS